jgi:hypothetical protein
VKRGLLNIFEVLPIFRLPNPIQSGRIARLLVTAAAVIWVPLPVHAQQLTVVIQGYVNSGTDFTGVFGGGTNSSLAGKAFTFNGLIDPSKGESGDSRFPNGVAYASSLVSNATRGNPLTGDLTINGHTVDFGTFKNPPISLIQSVCSGP